jgi:hypothetical protein
VTRKTGRDRGQSRKISVTEIELLKFTKQNLKLGGCGISFRIRKVCLAYAQDLRDQEEKDSRWCVAVAKLIKDARFNSGDYDLLRSSLDQLQEVRVC